jgi:hypothetical protein
MRVEVEAVQQVTDELVYAARRLLPQLPAPQFRSAPMT